MRASGVVVALAGAVCMSSVSCAQIVGLRDFENDAGKADGPADVGPIDPDTSPRWPDSPTRYCIDGDAEVACDGGSVGQDGEYLTDVPSYLRGDVAGNPVRTDTVTGLTWWESPFLDLDVPSAEHQCAQLPGSDWHLATRLELVSLIDYGSPVPIGWLPTLPSGTQLSTSTPSPSRVGSNFRIQFYRGKLDVSGLGPTNTSAYPTLSADSTAALCVRGALRSVGAPAVTTDAGIIDPLTGLMWTADVRQGTNRVQDWHDALSYCRQFIAGFNDWRLPTIKELQTIYDDTSPAGTAGWRLRIAVRGAADGWLWSSTPQVGYPGHVYVLRPESGETLGATVGGNAPALCVRRAN